MVALATTTQLPPLSQEDKHRLRRFFALHQSLEALAADLSESHQSHQSHQSHSHVPNVPNVPTQDSGPRTQDSLPPDEYDLASWLTSESIAPHLTFHKSIRDNADKQLAIQTLKEVIATAPNPAEKRRAATTLLRALAHQLLPSRRGPQTDRDSRLARDSRQSPDPSPAHPFTSSPVQPPPPIPTILEAYANKEGQIQTPSDCPLPLPERTPEDIVAIALHAIKNPDTPSTDAGPVTLYNLLGYIHDRTIESLHEFKRNALKNWVHEAWGFTSAGEPAPFTWAYGVGTTIVPVTLSDGLVLKFTFEVDRPRSGTLTGCWKLRHFRCQFRCHVNSS